MTERELLELLVKTVTGMDQRLSGVEGELKGVKAEVGGLKADVGGLKADVGGLKADVGGLKADVGELKLEVAELKTAQVRMENDLDAKIGALKDGFEMRGDQIERLQEHLDDRLDSIQNDLSYVVAKVAQHDRKFIQIGKNSRGKKI